MQAWPSAAKSQTTLEELPSTSASTGASMHANHSSRDDTASGGAAASSGAEGLRGPGRVHPQTLWLEAATSIDDGPAARRPTGGLRAHISGGRGAG
mmetsp:Transcript_36944/g.94263  ORF Transcript_36944/g.94263 Transcript_36944/m.94263 type:complete len:96 (-) Transcript_36944:2-289(-)